MRRPAPSLGTSDALVTPQRYAYAGDEKLPQAELVVLDFPEVYQAGVALSGCHDARFFNQAFVEAYDGADNPEAWARTSNVDIADRLAGKLLLIHGELDDQVHPDHTLRLADRLIADKEFELLIVPGAEHMFIDCLAYVRKRCWDFLVRELMGAQPPAYRPTPIALGPELLGELFG
ncbi:alpha/beta hydrolase family protein [Streptomyces sp. NPDC003480]